MSNTLRTTRLHVLAGAALIAAVASGSLPTPETAMAATTYQVELTCPIDGQRFTATLMGSYFQSGMRLDFKPIGSLIAPYPYPVCPGNGFVMYQDAFSDDQLSVIKSMVVTDEYRQLRTENTDYFMVAYIKQRLGANHHELGQAYLRASWEAERAAPESVDRYRMLARQAFDSFIRGKSTYSEEWWTAAVLAAELDRLLGNFNAVELRISVLPISELGFRHPDLAALLHQTRMHAHQRNSAPEQMQPPTHGHQTSGPAPRNTIN